MRYLLYFLCSSSIIFFLSLTEPIKNGTIIVSAKTKTDTTMSLKTINQPLTNGQRDSISKAIPQAISVNLPSAPLSAADIVRWLLSYLGGLLTTIVLYFLHRWFPTIFPTSKTSNYIQQTPPQSP